MIRSLAVVVAMALGAAEAQEVEGQGLRPHSHPVVSDPVKKSPGPARPDAPDYRVVFWFAGSDWKHQVYDVRKGQYTRAVEDWVLANRFEVDPSGYLLPGRMATVRDVVLKDQSGTTEQEKLDSAIQREQATILGAGQPATVHRTHRFALPEVPSSRTGERARRPTPGPWEFRRPPGQGSAPLFGPPVSRSPFPYPYPRPHP